MDKKIIQELRSFELSVGLSAFYTSLDPRARAGRGLGIIYKTAPPPSSISLYVTRSTQGQLIYTYSVLYYSAHFTGAECPSCSSFLPTIPQGPSCSVLKCTQTVQCTRYSLHYTEYSAQCTVHSAQCTVLCVVTNRLGPAYTCLPTTPLWPLHLMYSGAQNAQYTVYSVHSVNMYVSLNSLFYALYTVYCAF